jgi:hypothetical protein
MYSMDPMQDNISLFSMSSMCIFISMHVTLPCFLCLSFLPTYIYFNIITLCFYICVYAFLSMFVFDFVLYIFITVCFWICVYAFLSLSPIRFENINMFN